jgi:ribosomal protein S18 acetylase RimI-like enzyme
MRHQVLMTTLEEASTPTLTETHLRPFDARRDLGAVADLIELGFAETLDEDGRSYLKQMRDAARNLGWFGWAGIAPWSSVPGAGYIWEENGKVVGNLSLIPYLMGGRRYFLIANVVVHPDYRRRGIGRALTEKGIEHGRRAAAPAVWLHVREENASAIALYQRLGFRERARRTTWNSSGSATPSQLEAGVQIGPRQRGHWSSQRLWLEQNYPPELTWSIPLKLNTLRPGIWSELVHWFSARSVQQWSVQRDQALAGVAAWRAPDATSHGVLLLAAPQEADEGALQALLAHVRRYTAQDGKLVLEYPANQSLTALRAAGFVDRQTLIWMEKKL